jgi:hypothetical protein
MTDNTMGRKYHEKLESMGHKLIRDENGDIDDFRLDVDSEEGFGGHNGPQCELCGDMWCIWCLSANWEKIQLCKGKGA